MRINRLSNHTTGWLVGAALVSGNAIGCTNEPAPLVEEHPEVVVIEPLVRAEGARAPEEDSSLRDVDVQVDRVILSYAGSPMIPLAVGNIIGGHRDGGYLRRITGVNELGDGRFEYLTEEASIADALSGGAFDVNWVGGAAGAEDFNESPDATSDVATEALRLNFLQGFTGDLCDGAAGGNLTLTPNIRTSLTPTARFRMSPLSAEVSVRGSVTAGITATATANGVVRCAADLSTVLSPEQLSAISWNSTRSIEISFFTVNITQRITPYADWNLNGTVNTGRTSFNVTANASLRVGLEYERGEGFNGIWEPRFRTATSFEALQGGAAHIDSQLNAGVRYNIGIGAFGVSVNGEARLGGRAQGAADVNLCEWSVNASANASAGLTASAFGASFTRDWPLGSPAMLSRMGRVRTCSDVGRVDAGPQPDARGPDAREADAAICLPALAACTESDTCCGTSDCDWNGASRQCCRNILSSCTNSAECCGAAQCVGNRCVTQAAGAACERTADCAGGRLCRPAGGGAICSGGMTGCTCQ